MLWIATNVRFSPWNIGCCSSGRPRLILIPSLRLQKTGSYAAKVCDSSNQMPSWDSRNMTLPLSPHRVSTYLHLRSLSSLRDTISFSWMHATLCTRWVFHQILTFSHHSPMILAKDARDAHGSMRFYLFAWASPVDSYHSYYLSI